MARADEAPTPVVVELYTSQGCIACPPADALFRDFASMDGVIALALHVDYWDYMGWRDEFGRPEYTVRQKAYARVAGSRTLYTPQMVVQGEDQMKGHDAEAIRADIARRQGEAARATVSGDRADGKLTLHMAPVAGPVGAADVQLVSYVPSRTVAIERGDNAGQEIAYTNIVTDWRVVGRWDGSGPFEMTLADAPAGPLAVVVQQARMGPVLAATLLP
ncbi:MAG: DUF1223 domain-containing protein [Amaricoccus sp.]|uniref:DUF1223 domain-containing protein n=1 Tax=Amaricoccus sp. TaxID=1872485 RepID=UPI0039E4C9FB